LARRQAPRRCRSAQGRSRSARIRRWPWAAQWAWRLLVKTKNGRVGEIGIGDPRLSSTPQATKRFLNAWKRA
jgi:hypothetical protein